TIDSCDIGDAKDVQVENAAGKSTRRHTLTLPSGKRRKEYQGLTTAVKHADATDNGTKGKTPTRVAVNAAGNKPFYAFSPDIDYKFLIYFIVSQRNHIITKIGYNHNSFPDYEVRIDDTVVYKYPTKGSGPGLWNLAIGPNVKGVNDGPTIDAPTKRVEE